MGIYSNLVTTVWLVSCLIFSITARCDWNKCDNVKAPTSFLTDDGGESRKQVVDTLVSYLGVKELTGNNDGKEVEMFIASTGLNPKGGYPWCAAFISYVYQANSLSVPKWSARAAAWFDEEHIIPNKEAIEGDLFSLYYRKLARIGHIAMNLKPYSNPTPYVVTGEGNTNAQGSPEGNQAAKRMRPKGVVHSSANWIDL